jgi:predicted PhzF superfamily epimerase YddE/YHI9
VSRYFAPSYGIPEDPVTGSTHCTLAPYWAERLGKKVLHARQISERGGDLIVEPRGGRVLLKGKAVLYLAGQIAV